MIPITLMRTFDPRFYCFEPSVDILFIKDFLMNNDIKYFASDISHLVLDATDPDCSHQQFRNNHTGFRKFAKLLGPNSHCVMEATGYYHYQLAYHLLESGIRVSVENPLAVKRFIQMKLSKIKTDKSDSCIL